MAVRVAVRTMLEKEPDLHVMGWFGRGSLVEVLVCLWQPDIRVVVVNMPGLDSAAVPRRLNEHRLPCISWS
jgi:hypothetical protein